VGRRARKAILRGFGRDRIKEAVRGEFMVVPAAESIIRQPTASAHGPVILHRPVVTPLQTPPVSASTHLTQAVPIAVNKAPNVDTANAQIAHMINPGVVFIPPHRLGRPRDAFDLPTLVVPENPPTDQMLLEAPRDPTKRWFTPHYAIATAPGAGPRQQWVALEATTDGCKLTVHLREDTSAALASGNARIQPSAIRYFLTATLQSRAVNWDLTAAPSPQGADLTLTLELSSFADRDLLYAAMTDPSALAKLIIRREVDVAAPVFAPPAAYLQSTAAIDTTVPFTFSKDLDANVFARLTGGVGQISGWNVCSVNWKGRAFTYYQSASQLTQVYFLPDAFQIDRQPTPPHGPSITIAASGTNMSDMQMTLSYLALPIWDPNRIAAAATELQRDLALQGTPNLALFQASDATLLLSVPNPDGAGNSVLPQKDALIDVSAGVKGSVTMDVGNFRQVYNALFDPNSALLSGEVQVKVGTDVARIPFRARIADMTTGIVRIDQVVDVRDNGIGVSITNAIESPVHVDSLSGTITRAGLPLPTIIKSIAPALPVVLAPAGAKPAASIVVVLSPNTGAATEGALGGLIGGLVSGHGPTGGQVAGTAAGLANAFVDQSCTAVLDLSGVKTAPDPQALWRILLVDEGANPVTRQVTLKFVAAMLSKSAPAPSPPPAPGDMVMAVQVVFEGGQTATFDASQTPDAAGFLNQTLKLSVPIDAFVLSNAPIDSYRYRTDVVTGAGIRAGAWVSDNRDTIFVAPT
jgi:hypothetical protein